MASPHHLGSVPPRTRSPDRRPGRLDDRSVPGLYGLDARAALQQSDAGLAAASRPRPRRLIAGYLLLRVFPNARGSGIPQTKAALIAGGGYIGMKTVFGKFLCWWVVKKLLSMGDRQK